jgi:hypothetical protein
MDGFFSLSTGVSVPIGCIVAWYGTANTVPRGWGLCNGSSYTRSDGSGSITSPNLTDLVIVGAGDTYSPNDVGGSTTQTPVFANTTLTVAQMPSHGHGYSDPGHTHGVFDPSHSHSTQTYINDSGSTPTGSGANYGDSNGTFGAGTGVGIYGSTCNITISNNGGGGSHGHTSSVMSVVQPYLALYHIIKV